MSDEKSANKTAELIKKDFDKIDILVNNAGIVNGKPFLERPCE